MTQSDATEIQDFARLQERLAPLFLKVFPDPLEPRSVVVIPSLSLDAEVLAKVTGVAHYEQRMLCMLMLLRLPRTRVIFVSSLPVAPTIVDYYLHLLPGIPSFHARRRLTLLNCHDASALPLTRKILDRPRLLQRILEAIGDPSTSHLSCFNVTALERHLALRLDVPIYGCDSSLCDAGSKSGSREVFRQAGLTLPEGFERLRDMTDVAEALTSLRLCQPELRRAVVKLEEGISGEGNAVFSFDGAPDDSSLEAWVRSELPRRLDFEAEGESWERFADKYSQMGGITEAWVEGVTKRSPSVQCRIDPVGQPELISTHDQILGGPSGQVFKGSTFPADEAYRLEIQQAGAQVAEVLKERAVIGRFGVDFVSVWQDDRWQHYAIEINLRKGGTTHTFMMLQFLTAGSYETATGLFRTPNGQARFYYASDNLKSPSYRGLLPYDLIEIAVDNGLHFDSSRQQGVVFHLIGTLSEFGKLGLVCVGDSAAKAELLYRETVAVIDREAQTQAAFRDRLG